MDALQRIEFVRSHGTAQARRTPILVLLLAGTTAYAQATPGDNFNAALEDACSGSSGPALVGICDEFRQDGGSDGPNGGVGGQNNFDTLAAQNQTTADREERGRIFEAPTWSVFGSVDVGSRQRSTTALEQGYDGDVVGASIGADKSFTDTVSAGLVFSRFRFDANFDLAAGSIETETNSFALYLTYAHGESSTISAYIGRDSIDLESVRNIQVPSGPKQAASRTGASQNVAGINFYFDWPRDAWLFGADLSVDYVDARIDAFQEVPTMGDTNYLVNYPDQNIESLTLSTGFEVAYNASLSWGVLVPRARISYVHETENESRGIVGSLVAAPDVSFTTTTDDADDDFFVGSMGTSAVLADGWNLFADASAFAGNSVFDSWVISLGVHKQF
jgi:uncharacterized protein YhjY with autotransporter beta-barrel domain